ncbi:IS982 family transposase [Limosilactobacillus ingluviei]|uniref:IS982 family transposase n=1 Tax=Limosilactobacillus ingluviei TaxID=148604 RepID=UPI0002EE99DD|nr:IS982 family transposase [Limosilactobacillus ingluviei]
MLSYFKSSYDRHDFQVVFAHTCSELQQLMQDFVPRKFMERRNIEHVKLSDAEIMALMLLKTQYHVSTWTAFYDLVQATIPSLPLLEYSRLIRRINQVTPVFQAIRRGLLTWTTPSQTAIIDSYPLPLCQGVRNARARLFTRIADIGYNATKQLYFYGFKVHMIVEPSGLILDYEVTPASIHDVKAAPELIQNCPYPQILADVGYVGKDLRSKVKQQGHDIWTPYRSNMKGAKQHNRSARKRTRRLIETAFAKLKLLRSEQTYARSLVGLQAQIEALVMTNNLAKFGMLQTSN